MQTDLLPAFIIHRRRFRETSLLLEILSPQIGRLGVIARGALRGKRGGGEVLQAFHPLKMSWRGRGALPTLTRHEPVGRAYPLRGNRLYAGFYVNELVMRLTAREDPNPELFAAYQNAVAALGEDAPLEPILRQFEVALLGCCGIGIVLDREVSGDTPIEASCRYHYDENAGPVPTASEQPGTEAVRGETLLALAAELPWTESRLREAKHLMRRIIRYHAGDRPFESRRLFTEASS